MKGGKRKRRGRSGETGWVPRSTILRAFDVSDWRLLANLVPDDCVRQCGRRRYEYYARGVIDAWVAYRKPHPPESGHSQKTEGLLRIQDLKAQRLALVLERDLRAYVPLREMERVHAEILSALRRLQGEMGARFGREAWEMAEAALEAAERVLGSASSGLACGGTLVDRRK